MLPAIVVMVAFSRGRSDSIRMYTHNTVEESIVQLQRRKQALGDKLLDGGGEDEVSTVAIDQVDGLEDGAAMSAKKIDSTTMSQLLEHALGLVR